MMTRSMVVCGGVLVICAGVAWYLRNPEEEEERQEEERLRVQRERQEAERRRGQQQQQQQEQRHQLLLQEQERLRIEKEQAEAEAEAEVWLAGAIDLHIRTRRRFDCRTPRAYWCALDSIRQAKEVREALDGLQEYYDVTLTDFIAEEPSLELSSDGTRARVRHLTPFQGGLTHRVYGHFKCGGCQRGWESAATWVNKWQKCKGCEAENYPYEQHLLERHEKEGEQQERRPHDMTRCQRCRELGRICVPSMYYSHTG